MYIVYSITSLRIYYDPVHILIIISNYFCLKNIWLTLLLFFYMHHTWQRVNMTKVFPKLYSESFALITQSFKLVLQ